MSKTVEDLVSLFYHKLNGPDDATAEDAMRVVVTALRDEILRDYGGNNHSWCERVALGAINEILAPREGGQAAGGPTREDGRGVEQLVATASHAVTAPAAPAPNPLRDAIARARGRPLDPERDIPTLNKVAAALKSPAPVCEWGFNLERSVWHTRCGQYYGPFQAGDKEDAKQCHHCSAPISFKTEAQR